MLKIKTYKSLLNFRKAANDTRGHRLKMKQREENSAYFVMNCMLSLRLMKVGLHVSDAKRGLMKLVFKPKLTHFHAMFVLLV